MLELAEPRDDQVGLIGIENEEHVVEHPNREWQQGEQTITAEEKRTQREKTDQKVKDKVPLEGELVNSQRKLPTDVVASHHMENLSHRSRGLGSTKSQNPVPISVVSKVIAKISSNRDALLTFLHSD